ncbi:MAG: ribonuclease D [Deltaproteobacteria bacterium]|nr:ribonuclease D [Deltaproteobacteria bacterium]
MELCGQSATQTIYWINSQQGLLNAAAQLGACPLVAVDLEADSMYHFTEKICLIQTACENGCYIIDPLSIEDISPLGPVFADPGITKIFHGADYDVRSLYRDFSFTVNSLFDTQEACRFLGYPQTGLGAIVERHFNITLDKRFQKKDWSRRPIGDAMVAYAANDVLYLIRLYEIFQKRLAEKKRLAWAVEAGRDISKVRPDMANGNGPPLFLRFKGAGRLDPLTLAVLELLLEFRRDVARAKDRPPFKVVGNAALLKIAVNRPDTADQLKRTCGLSPLQMKMYAAPMLDCVRQALEIEEKDLPRYPRNRAPRMPMAAVERQKMLKQWREKTARGMEMDPALILNKVALHELALASPGHVDELVRIDGLKDWQKKEFGEAIVGVLSGYGQ